MRTVLLVIGGMIIMYVILRVLSGAPESTNSWPAIKAMIKTQEFNNIIKTNEFRELAKTSEFRNVVASLAEEQVKAISSTLVG
jgi:hypothetical protein